MPRTQVSDRRLLRTMASSLTVASLSTKITSGSNVGVTGASSFSMGGWWKPSKLQIGVAYGWLCTLGTTAANKAWTLGVTGTGFLELGGYGVDQPSVVKPRIGEWGHLVGTFDGTTSRTYWNGVLIKEIATGFTPNIDNCPLVVGQFAGNSPALGQHRETFLYNRVLTLEEIKDIYYNGKYAASPTVLYMLDDGSGSTATDSSGNSNNGTITSPSWSTDVPITVRTQIPILQNYLVRSEEFDNASWTKSGCSVLADQVTAPDGATTADKLTESSINENHFIYQTTTNILLQSKCTLSVYAKIGTRRYITLQVADNSGYQVTFDLQSGTVTYESGALGVIESVGNGWYRCSITFVSVGGAQTARIWMNNSSGALGNYLGDGSYMYIWGAQLVRADWAGKYTVTTSAASTSAIRSRPPCAQNILTYSNDLTNAAWTKTGSTTTYNQTGFDGTACSELKEASGTTAHKAGLNPGQSNGKVYTFSVIAKKAATSRDWILLTTNNGNNGAWFNINTGLVGISANILSSGIVSLGNGYYRCWITYNKTGTVNDLTEVWIANGDGGSVYAGDTSYSVILDRLMINEGTKPGPLVVTSGAAVNQGIPRHQLIFN